jgi:hypothetical protein
VVSPKRSKTPIVQKSEQSRLCVGREIGHFVEEERAAFGDLHFSNCVLKSRR